MQFILATPEYIKAEIDARYGSQRRRRTGRAAGSPRVTTRIPVKRTDETARPARVAVAH